MLIIATRSSLAHFRHNLLPHARSVVPALKSAQLCEAVAKSLGCGSHAALLAKIDADERFFPVLDLNANVLIDGLLGDRANALDAERDMHLAYRAMWHGLNDAGIQATYNPIALCLNPERPWSGGQPSINHANVVRLIHDFTRSVFNQCVRDAAEPPMRPSGENRCLTMARIVASWRHLDPQIADFLSEYLVACVDHHAKDAEDPSRWGEIVFETYIGRIVQFLNAISRTWGPDIDPFSLPLPEPIKRRHKHVEIVLGRSDDSSKIGLEETGSHLDDYPNLIGVCMLAKFLGSSTAEEMKRTANELYLIAGELKDCLRWAGIEHLHEEIAQRWASSESDRATYNSRSYRKYKFLIAYDKVFEREPRGAEEIEARITAGERLQPA